MHCEVEMWCTGWQGRGEVSSRGKGVWCIVGMGMDVLYEAGGWGVLYGRGEMHHMVRVGCNTLYVLRVG